MRRLLAIFALSGAAGLIYEVVWARELVLVFGNTTQAVSAILTGFFGGMAVGSAVGGRIADRVRHPLRMYAVLELILVAVVLLTPWSFSLVGATYRALYPSLASRGLALALLRYLLSLVALAPATVLMGATLPTLTRHLARRAGELGASFGRLYAANTIGAIAGTVAAGFALIELLGLHGALLAGAACSGTAGIAALLLARTPSPLLSDARSVGDSNAGASQPSTPKSGRRLALLVAGLSGFTSLGYQTLWTRELAEGTGNSTYVFSAILALFLCGLALGALAFSFLRRRSTDAISLVAYCQLLIAVLVLLGYVLVIGHGSGAYLPLARDFGATFIGFVEPVALVVLPATFVMGIVFPASTLLFRGSDENVGADSGALLAVNTVGAILGSFLVPFVLIPVLGSPVSVALLIGTNAVAGIGLALGGPMRRASHRMVVASGSVVVAALVVIAVAGGTLFVDPNVLAVRAQGGLLYASTEDAIASVQAGELGNLKQLWVTGTSMTAITVDTKLMSLLPLMLRPQSTSELVIAFGMGTAYRTGLIAGLKVDAVELVPSVPGMFGYFYPDAGSVMADPKGHVVVDDGRNYVEMNGQRYDFIVVDPPPPIESSGASVISSLEFYRAASKRLTSNGVMMQWVPVGLTLKEFKAHVRTFASVFPHVIVAVGPAGHGFYMLGSEGDLHFTTSGIRGVLNRSGVVADLGSAPDSPHLDAAAWMAEIQELVRLEGSEVTSYAGSGPIVTDDRPYSEYFLLRHLLGRPSPEMTTRALTR